MKYLTSFSPTRTEAQHKAIATWKQPIVAVQCEGEDYAKEFTDDIIWVKPNLYWSKRTPSIVDLLHTIYEPTLLINSDIELECDPSQWEAKPNTLKIGLRTDYCPQFMQLNKYGMDVFLLTPEMAGILTNNIWALGIPGWDYWLVWKLLQEGYSLEIEREGFMHKAHREQWNQEDYKRCAKLLEFEFKIPVQDIADQLQIITDRVHLSKRTV